jgi:hypothetical protein
MQFKEIITVCSVSRLKRKYIVTYTPIAKQWFGKHIPAEAYARKNRTSIARQRINKQGLSTIDRLFSAWSVPRGYKGTKKVVGVREVSNLRQ